MQTMNAAKSRKITYVYVFSRNCFRTADREAELDSSTLDLDQSFQRLLNEKREMTNKENNPPPNPTHTSAVPEKPLRTDLLRERLIEKMHTDSLNGSSSMYHAIDSSSYTFQNTFSNDEEYAAINRLMADCNIEYELANNIAIGLSRPSTIVEESTIRSDFDEQHSVGKPSSSQSTASTSSMSSVVRVEHYPNVLRELKTEEALNATTDDTLEEIEYVRTETGLNYVPKKKAHTISETGSIDENEIILIDSSPENSFVTTRNAGYFTSAESTEYSFHTAKADFTGKSKNSELSNDVESIELENNDVELENDDRTQSTTDTLCHDASDNHDSQQPKTPRHVSTGSELEYISDSLSEMPEFNNTLERIEFMIKQGQKMLKRSDTGAVAKKSNQNSPMISSRTPTACVSEKKMTPAKKLPFKPSPAVKTNLFKRPEQRVRSPAVMSSGSKIPKPMTSASKPQFRHIASPIAAYIKNTPEIPLIKTVKPTNNFYDSSYYNKMIKSHDESTMSVENYSIKSSLPRKFCNAAPQRQVHECFSSHSPHDIEIRHLNIRWFNVIDNIFLQFPQIVDNRHIVTPGGKSVQKLIGNAPLIIRHDGRLKSNLPASNRVEQQEESFSDLSMMSGDISVQVVRDVNRKY